MPIGVDIGATTTRVALVRNHRPVKLSRRPTRAIGISGPEPTAFVRLLADQIRSLLGDVESCASLRTGPAHNPRTHAIGVALAGLVDRGEGRVIRSVNLPFLDGFPLANSLGEELRNPVRLMTDIDAATWGEFTACWPRRGRFAHLRLGSGVGCGLVLNGELLGLDEPRKTHAPSLIADSGPEAPRCACGLRGCLELFASGRSLAAAATNLGLPATLSGLRSAWSEGQPEARRVASRACAALGAVTDALRQKFDLEQLVLGGGVLAAWPELLEVLVESNGGGTKAAIPLMTGARLGDESGVIGAAALAETP